MSTGMAKLRKSLAVLARLIPVLLIIVIFACRQEAPMPDQTPSVPTPTAAQEMPSVPAPTPTPTLIATPTPPVAKDEEGNLASAKGMYETCPAFDPAEKEGIPRMLPAMPGRGDDVTLHPKLVEDTIKAIKRKLKDPHTIKRLEIEEAGEAIAVTVTDTGPGDRWTGPRHKLEDGRELYWNIHLWGWATFEDGSEISFHVWAAPAPSGLECEIQGVAIQPSSFVPI